MSRASLASISLRRENVSHLSFLYALYQSFIWLLKCRTEYGNRSLKQRKSRVICHNWGNCISKSNKNLFQSIVNSAHTLIDGWPFLEVKGERHSIFHSLYVRQWLSLFSSHKSKEFFFQNKWPVLWSKSPKQIAIPQQSNGMTYFFGGQDL